jgi:hypothetical protein
MRYNSINEGSKCVGYRGEHYPSVPTAHHSAGAVCDGSERLDANLIEVGGRASRDAAAPVEFESTR